MNFAVFGQTVIVPLLHEHKILTQVAGYHTEVIKFLPPMTVTKEDMDWFLSAMEQVLDKTTKTSSTLKTMFRLGVGAVRA
jgi:ornithine--oxo-acid transaminase